MVIKNARIVPVNGEELDQGYIRFNERITEIGPMECYEHSTEEQEIDAGGKWVLPGLVDAHTHLGLFGDSVGFEAEDCNEVSDPVTPQLRVIDGINPLDRTFAEAREGGITSVAVAPGSANAIGGQLAMIHTSGRRVDDMILRAPLGIKFALGENPKTTYHDRDETPSTRMATAALIREQLFLAREYMEKKRAQLTEDGDAPDFDIKLEALQPLLRREIQAHFHAHRLDDIFTAIRIGQEFDLDYVIIHGTEAYLAADIMAAEGARIVTGPNLLDRCKPELKNMSFEGPGMLRKAGVLCAICTDHPETPLQYLPLCAAIATKWGLSREEALKTVTWYPAVITGMEKEIGSLEPGKRADLIMTDGDPLDIATDITGVWIDGVLCAGRKTKE